MNKKNKTAIVLLLVIAMAFIVSALDKGVMLGLFDRTKRNKTPSDTRENLFYNRKKPCTSANVLDRSGFAFLNLRERIVAVQLSSGINITVVNRGGDQGLYRKFSEYAGNIYLYDGESLWRTGIDGKRVSQIADGVLDYEPMGDHIYFLKIYQDEPRLFRSRLNGSGQEALFDHPVHAFRAFGGNILMLLEERNGEREQRYTRYSVLDRRSMDLVLPAGAGEPELDGEALYYVAIVDGEQAMFRHTLSVDAAAEIIAQGFTAWEAGPDGIAMLMRDGDTGFLRYIDKETGDARDFLERRFSLAAAVDLSWDRVYVTEADGVFHSSVAVEEWAILPVETPGGKAAGTPPASKLRKKEGNQGAG